MDGIQLVYWSLSEELLQIMRSVSWDGVGVLYNGMSALDSRKCNFTNDRELEKAGHKEFQ